jgi:hypothetical protein
MYAAVCSDGTNGDLDTHGDHGGDSSIFFSLKTSLLFNRAAS